MPQVQQPSRRRRLQYQPDLQDDYRYSARAVGVTLKEGLFGNLTGEFVGMLEAFVCTECGYYESYVMAPEAFDWSRVSGLVMLNADKPDPEGPFR